MSKSKVAKLPARHKREWKAAKVDVIRSDWPTWSRPPDADIRYGLRVLRSRARHEAQNNDHARAFLREVKSNVIGPKGVRLQSKARVGGGRPDERARQVIEDAWHEWGMVGSCDVTGRLGWEDVQHQCIETIARDGEAIFRLVDTGANEYGLEIQALDPETLDVEYNEARPDGTVVIMGVELNEWNRPVAYHLQKEDSLHLAYRPMTGGRRRNRERMSIPADEIVHLYLPEWTVHTRGVPWMATALRRMTDLCGYDESAVVAARSGASKMGFFKQSEDAPPTLNEDGTPHYGVVDAEGADGQLYSSFDPGSIGLLPPGYDFTGWNPSYPHANHGDFTKAVLRGIAAGLGLNYNSLASDGEGVNYSTMRHFALVDRAVWMMLQEWLIRSFHTRVYRTWLANALGSGVLVDARGRPLSRAREREFQRVYWQPRRWQWVDPKNDAETAILEIHERLRSRSSVIRERGEDPDEVWAEIAAENEMLAELGISPAQANAAAVGMPAEPEADDENEDETDDE